ncbi:MULTISPECIES: hypothetical protein [unclassified Halomonas]|uniref:hypothetical protein n=1 Tax=unclassified Halomonas TaxID=2609666 RepID=UPI0021E40753|nr:MULTISPECIES: hypothetical protein [unclassified Halomonas]UYG00175.1 hypothetical protein OCT39_01080 [Halomonas sp. GD1P12]WNL38737.1 hypothetical protein RN346_15795 [Halomonas sp. PAMB 3232]
MHQHIEWDDPGKTSVSEYFKNDPNHDAPRRGDILSARYQNRIVRVKVETYREDEGVSVGSVAAILDAHGHRFKTHGKLSLDDIVRLPDDKRAMEHWDEGEK